MLAPNLLGDDGYRGVVKDLLASEPHHPDGPWHVLLREQLGSKDCRALLAELETEGRGKVAEPAAPHDPSKMTQGRLFD